MKTNLYKVEDIVKKVLEKYPDSRNNDDVLIFRVYKEINEDVMIRELFCEVLLNRKKYNLPSYKSIERCRRKLVKEYPELKPVEEVQKARDKEENNYINYAIGGYTSSFMKFVDSQD